jgi:hypothetical protein
MPRCNLASRTDARRAPILAFPPATWGLLARLPVRLSDLGEPADRKTLGALLDARLARLVLGGRGEVVVARAGR